MKQKLKKLPIRSETKHSVLEDGTRVALLGLELLT